LLGLRADFAASEETANGCNRQQTWHRLAHIRLLSL
jgi:hypothetical protein